MKRGTIILLIGQKGSGKSFIGSLLETEFNIKFLRVENWAKEVKRNRSINDDTYLQDVFRVIEKGVRREAVNYDSICFESTGLTIQFDKMLENLRNEFNIITLKILFEPDICIERIKLRDRHTHIDVSDDEIQRINTEVLKRNHKTDYELENNAKSNNELIKELGVILKNISINTPDNKFERR